jgi:hypothetical protein
MLVPRSPILVHACESLINTTTSALKRFLSKSDFSNKNNISCQLKHWVCQQLDMQQSRCVYYVKCRDVKREHKLCTTLQSQAYITRTNNRINSVFMMKLSGHFLLLALTIVVAESTEQVDSETVCVETKDVSIFYYNWEHSLNY